MRASHAEREHAVQQLSAACAEGRLTLEELGVRVATAYSAVARGELDVLLSDLPDSTWLSATPGSFRVGAPAGVVDVKRHRARGKWIVSSHRHDGRGQGRHRLTPPDSAPGCRWYDA